MRGHTVSDYEPKITFGNENAVPQLICSQHRHTDTAELDNKWHQVSEFASSHILVLAIKMNDLRLKFGKGFPRVITVGYRKLTLKIKSFQGSWKSLKCKWTKLENTDFSDLGFIMTALGEDWCIRCTYDQCLQTLWICKGQTGGGEAVYTQADSLPLQRSTLSVT